MAAVYGKNFCVSKKESGKEKVNKGKGDIEGTCRFKFKQ